jgi:hypothetical protein
MTSAFKVEAECTINTLLPIIKNQYPDAVVKRYLSHETVDRWYGCMFDADKGLLVNSLSNDHFTFIDEEIKHLFSSDLYNHM